MKTRKKLTKAHKNQAIPTRLTQEQFNQFVLPHLTVGRRGPNPKLSLYTIFNYILHLLHTGMQWMNLPIALDASAKPEIHYTRIFRIFQRWVNERVFEKIFEQSVAQLQAHDLLALSVLHGDGSSSQAKKGGEMIGYNGHKHFKGEKIIAIVDRHANVIAPYVQAPGNRNESVLLTPAMAGLKKQLRR